MCAICGIFNLTNGEKIEKHILENMLRVVLHRGPDGSDILMMDNIALGFNRLSFIDLDSGMQPIWNEDKTISMICNGEIFNFQTLCAEMKEKGHFFRTKTDIEVILHLYEEYGLDFPSRLNGQFAIALYDYKKKQLLLVRDQIGTAPLFYTISNGKLIFASEIKAILQYPGVNKKLNLKAVDQLMNYPGVVSPTTFFEGIYSLRGGHMLCCKSNQELKDIEYWDLVYQTQEFDKGESYYIEKLRELLKNAIARRLVADVPIGFYISGGLDSSMVACFIGLYMMNSYYSFSAEMESEELDESQFQKTICECVQSTHYSVRITEETLWENLGQVIYHAESGLKESYDVAAYLLSALVKNSPAKAVLTGQGSDEFFSGYVGYMVDQFRGMRKDTMSVKECEVNERLWGDPYFRYERNHSELWKIHSRIYSADIRLEAEKFSAIAESPINVERVKGLSSQKRRSYIDYKLRLSDHLLGEHGDRMFFSHSVEGRHPFLDMELLSFVLNIPDKYKLNGVNEKYILKKAGKGIVPDIVLKRKKFPFQTPGMSAMIKKSYNEEFLNNTIIKKYNIFDINYINEMKHRYSQNDFKLMGAYEIDYLFIVMTVTMLCEQFHLSV